jgi:hypothetical protein
MHLLKHLLLLFTGMAADTATSSFPAGMGPCKPAQWKPSLPVPPALQALDLPKSLGLTVTIPQCPDGAMPPFGPSPFPVLCYFNGFMVRLPGL